MDTYDLIDNAINARHISRRKLAQGIGVAPSTFQSMMSRKRGLTFDMLMQIVAFLQISPEAFWTNANDDLSLAYDTGIKDGAELEAWSNQMIDELTRREGYSFSEEEGQLITAFSSLNPSGQTEAVKRVSELTEIPRYQRSDAQDAAKGTEDTSLPAEAPINGSESPAEGKK